MWLVAPPVPTSRLERFSSLLPMIVPVAVVATFFIFYTGFILCSKDQPCSPFTAAEILAGVSSSDQTRVASYVARATWTLINGINLFACVLAILTAAVIIFRALDEYEKKIRWWMIAIVMAAALNVSLPAAYFTFNDVLSPAQQLVQATIGQVVPAVNKYNRLADTLSLTGTFALAAATSATLWRRKGKRQDENKLLERIHLLRPVLFVGAAMLVITILRLSVTHAWGVSYLPPESDLAKALSTLTSGIVSSMGAVFTLLMAGIYLPAVVILRSRLLKVARTKKDPKAWLESHGASLSFSKLLTRIIALLAPLLVGPLGDLIIRATTQFGGQ